MSKKLSSGEGANRTFGFYAETDIFMVSCFANEYLYSADNTYRITDKHRQAYQYLNQMLNVDNSMPTPMDTQIMGGFDMFCAGKLAMVCDGTWWQQTARNITDFRIGVAAVPSLEGAAYTQQNGMAITGGTAGLHIGKHREPQTADGRRRQLQRRLQLRPAGGLAAPGRASRGQRGIGLLRLSWRKPHADTAERLDGTPSIRVV